MTAVAVGSHNVSKKRHVPGEVGLWIFVLGDMCVFALFFALWSISRAQHPDMFAQGHASISQLSGVINTLALLTSSFCVAWGMNQVYASRFMAARRAFLSAFSLGGVFVLVKIGEYRHKILGGADITQNEFDMYYFVLTGVHLLHVLVGMVALLLMIARCKRPLVGTQDVPFLEGAGVYWHMVDVLWIVLFLLIYMV